MAASGLVTLRDRLAIESDVAFSERAQWEVLWQRLSDYIYPTMSDFTRINTPGFRRDDRIIDSAGVRANRRFAASVFSFLTGEGTPWFTLRLADERLNSNREVRAWMDDTVQRMMDEFNSPFSRFSLSQEQKFLQIGAFGNAPIFIGVRNGRPYFQTEFLGNVAVWCDELGQTQAVYRRYEDTAWGLEQRFGKENLPKDVLAALTDKPLTKFKCRHIVRPWDDTINFPNIAGFTYLSAYMIGEDDKHFLHRQGAPAIGGYHENPWVFARWAVSPTENYGRGPGGDALGDVMMLQRVVRDTVKLIHKKTDPQWLVDDDGTLNPRLPTSVPGAVIYSRQNERGHWAVKQEPTVGDSRDALTYIGLLKDQIGQHFYREAFDVLPPTNPSGSDHRMSATEFAGRQRQQLQYAGPPLARMRSEDLMPTVARTFRVMWRNGLIAEVPLILQDALSAGVQMTPEYVSPLAVAQRAHESDTIMGFAGKIGALAAFDPRFARALHTERTTAALADSDHVPVAILSTPAEIAQQIQAEQEAAQAQAEAEQGKLQGDAAESNAKAISLIQGAA